MKSPDLGSLMDFGAIPRIQNERPKPERRPSPKGEYERLALMPGGWCPERPQGGPETLEGGMPWGDGWGGHSWPQRATGAGAGYDRPS